MVARSSPALVKPTTATILAQLDRRPALARALGTYAYTMEHVTGGSTSHAGAIQALDQVDAALPVGADASDVVEQYMSARDARGIAAKDLRRGDLLTWSGLVDLFISTVDRCGDGTVHVYAGPYGAELPPLIFACATRVIARRTARRGRA